MERCVGSLKCCCTLGCAIILHLPAPIFILLLYISPNQGLRRDLSPHTSHLHLHITPSSPHVTNYLFVNHVSPLFIASHHCTCDLFHPVSSRILSIWSYTYCLDLNTAIPSITMGFAFPLPPPPNLWCRLPEQVWIENTVRVLGVCFERRWDRGCSDFSTI